MIGKCGAAAALLLACSAVQAEEAPDPFDQLPNVHFAYYDVTGVSMEKISQSIYENGPRDLNSPAHLAARTEWSFDWTWKVEGEGKCDLSTTTASFRAFVILPSLADLVAPDVLKEWNAYLAKLRQREADQARYAYSHLPQLLAAIKGAPSCEAANKAGAAVLDGIKTYTLGYDAQTDHGRKAD
ncbi:putative secreted Zn-dependent protease [Rhizomicrobium palustre]|uniref:Putative secreted Zn-dependent protease n=1 Tax=Rhizomicrobium palustre TaxID=189966 RepID=A0A846N5S1_9PROT|nr:DUF922 domain-containing protein [Rhizomicrobium palustre]NIK90512.1 putative secreted Zn-dependent protease [Rhizomicrobium palustre]